MASGPALILETLDRHIAAPVHLRLMGGAALVLAYGLERSTEDADLLMDDEEAQFLLHSELRSQFRSTVSTASTEPVGFYDEPGLPGMPAVARSAARPASKRVPARTA